MAMIVGLHCFVSGRAEMITNVHSIPRISRTMYVVLMSGSDLSPFRLPWCETWLHIGLKYDSSSHVSGEQASKALPGGYDSA